MAFETEGILHKKFDTENKTASFQAREFVIRHEGNYPQFIKFQLTQDRCDIINDYNEGDQIKVSFDLRGREWNDKYFTNLNAWKIDKVETANSGSSESGGEFSPLEEPIVANSEETLNVEDFGDLPF